MRQGLLISLALATVMLSSCLGTSKNSAKSMRLERPSIGTLRLLDTCTVPYNMLYHGTVIGGLSGIDYVPGKNIYYLICDDPSAMSPARFYTAQVEISNDGIDSVVFVDVTTLLNPAGQPYPDIRKDRVHSADVEALRYDPVHDELVRSSEGQRVKKDTIQLQQPDIVMMERDGHFKDSMRLPPNVHVYNEDRGVRHNMVFEGVTFLDNYREMMVSVEDALYEDGHSAGTGDSTAWARILRFNREKKKPIAQYAYHLDAVPYAPVPAGAFKVNGISDILYIGNDQLLVLERAWSTGRGPSDVRLYLADFKKATDISNNSSLVVNPAKNPITKKLVLDLNTLGIYIDNIEGLTFGPDLPNGHRTIVMVSDNNFMEKSETQFLLFEVLP